MLIFKTFPRKCSYEVEAFYLEVFCQHSNANICNNIVAEIEGQNVTARQGLAQHSNILQGDKLPD